MLIKKSYIFTKVLKVKNYGFKLTIIKTNKSFFSQNPITKVRNVHCNTIQTHKSYNH